MTGIERLRELAEGLQPNRDLWYLTSTEYDRAREGRGESNVGSTLNEMLTYIADQIEAEQEERITRRVEDREAAEWVRAHGGLEKVRAHWEGRVAISHVEHMAKHQREKRERMQRHIECIQRLCRERRERISELNKTVAEMRSRLMPEGIEWPRFEDGEPVRIGDEFACWCGEVHHVHSVTIRDAKSIINMNNFHSFVVGEDSISCHGERVKRPAPKVLNADGVEIREKGDAWWICEGDEHGVHAERLRVETICPNGLVECSPYNGGTWVYLEPSELYVNKPVPASDGIPLREGETVWGIGRTQHEFVVLGQPGLGGGSGRFKVACHDVTDGVDCDCDPLLLTHERPENKCRDCAHWQKDPTAGNMGVCWFYYHEHEGQDCYAARRGHIGACEEFMPRGKALAERDA